MYVWSYLKNWMDVETIKIDDEIEAWTNKGWR